VHGFWKKNKQPLEPCIYIVPSLNECIDLLDLEVAYRFEDGVILQPQK